MRRWQFGRIAPYFSIIILAIGPGAAQAAPLPADCPTVPANPGDVTTIGVSPKLPAGPGLPKGGYAQVGVNVQTGGTICETAAPELPRDVLHGEPTNDVLGGDASTDILSGQPKGRVIVETR